MFVSCLCSWHLSGPVRLLLARRLAQIRCQQSASPGLQEVSYSLINPLVFFSPLLLKPCRFSPLYSTASDSTEDSYVPMRPSNSPSAPSSECSSDGYIPMSPGSATFTFPVVSTEKLTSPLPELPSDLEPPPVNRDLKPRRKCKRRPQVQLAAGGS